MGSNTAALPSADQAVTEIARQRAAAQEALRASEAKFAAAFGQSPLGLTITDLESGALLDVNDHLLEVIGYTRAEMLGQTPEVLGLWLDPAERRRRFETFRSGGRPPEIEAHFKVRDGRVLTALVASSLIDVGGRPAVLTSVVDITERKRVEAALARDVEDLRLLQGLSSQLVESGDVASFTQAILETARALMRSDFASLQRYRAETGDLELLGHIGFSAEAADRWRVVREHTGTLCGEALRSRQRVIARDFESSPHMAPAEAETARATGFRSCQSTPLLSRSGRVLGILSTHWSQPYAPPERDLGLLDIIARQAADYMERLENEQALRDSDRRKDEFLALLAHELRNPLAPLHTALAVRRATAGADELHEIMERQVVHLVRLVDDLLEVSRFTRGKIALRLEPIDFAAVVGQVTTTVRPRAEAAELACDFRLPAAPIPMQGDPVRLTQILTNLLHNAIKFTPRGGRIRLTLEAVEGQVLTRISDTGTGIRPELMSRIFGLFVQGDHSLERREDGLGIGLWLAQQLAGLHGGHIAVESGGPGAGSTFTLVLPAQKV